MDHDIAEALRELREEVRLLRGELVALGRVVEESVFLQALVAFDTTGDQTERAANAVKVLRVLAKSFPIAAT